MAKVLEFITDEIRDFITHQHVFFVSTAPLNRDGHINLSPKGLDSFRVLGRNRVGYLDVISSGNETSAHVLENGRITFMFCAFEGPPRIVRLYGRAATILPGEPEWESISLNFTIYPSTRQIIVADITRVQISCGYGVPLYAYEGERDQHFKWVEKIGPSGLEIYRDEHNLRSIDGLPTVLGLQYEE